MKISFFAFPVWMKIMKSIQQNDLQSISDLAKKTDITYSHVTKVIKLFVILELITEQKKGRIIKLALTQKGKELADDVIKVIVRADEAKQKSERGTE